MRLSAVRVFVDNLAEAKVFYCDVLGLSPLWEHDGIAIGFDLGATLILEPVGKDADQEDLVRRV